jgi:hypothetical protein
VTGYSPDQHAPALLEGVVDVIDLEGDGGSWAYAAITQVGLVLNMMVVPITAKLTGSTRGPVPAGNAIRPIPPGAIS